MKNQNNSICSEVECQTCNKVRKENTCARGYITEEDLINFVLDIINLSHSFLFPTFPF